MPACRDDVTALPPAEPSIAVDPPGDADRTLAFRRSLRASRARRAAAAVRRRRVLRGRGSALVAAAGMLVVSAGALGQQERSPGAGLSTATIAAAQRALGVGADGIVGPRTRRAVRSFQRAEGLIVDGVIGPQTLKALGVGRVAATAAARSAATAAPAAGSTLDRIAACESGGDPSAVSADGHYRGKYQFSLATWRQVGGSGDPAAASEAEQDKRAAMLYAQQGSSPWPVCGR
jgi:peptidoglycan hydrolase-like protein with peptidoglycan-binding domain